MEVIATDNGLPPLFSTSLVTILVEDTNDILPVFNESLYEADVPENEANYPIVTVEVRGIYSDLVLYYSRQNKNQNVEKATFICTYSVL